MTPSPLVSVLVPTYNGAAYVGHTLRSILSQTCADLEVIVVDDGSTDDTVNIVEAVAGDDPRVTVDAAANVGIFANPVRLLRRAHGRLVKFVLQDDVLEPSCIERLAAPLVAEPTIAMATSKRRRIDADGADLPDIPATTAIVEQPARIPGRMLGDHVLETQVNRIGELSTVLYRREVLDPDTLWDFPGWSVRGNGDVVVHLKALAAGDCWYEPEPLSALRVHDGQFGATTSVMIDCTLDWPYLIDGGRRLGFLADPDAEHRAYTAWLRHAGAFHAAVAGEPGCDELLATISWVADRLRSPGARSIGAA